mgnify:CR=1 FL=1
MKARPQRILLKLSGELLAGTGGAGHRRGGLALRDGVGRFVDEWERVPVLRSQLRLPAEDRAELRRIRLACRAQGLAASLRACGAGVMPFLGNRLSQLTVPVLGVAGEDDPTYRQNVERACSRIANAHAVVISGAGHSVHLERPVEFVREAERFVSGIADVS